jgi:hypothetical protein
MPWRADLSLHLLIGALPLGIPYAFFVEHYVSTMTGAVKE